MAIAEQPDRIPRAIESTARRHLESFPAIAITGPRQSGKTTLAQMLAPELEYRSLEDPDTRTYAQEDPRGFLADLADGAILDEVQRNPELFSYLQGVLDSDRRMGRFILTGSSQFQLVESITQSLAGRVSMLTLLPFSLAELANVNRAPQKLDQLLFDGLYPPLYDRPVDPSVWLTSYIATYLERDVKQLINIKDLATFQRFVQLCSGRIGQLLNINSLAADTGITRVTAQSWLSVLEASHLITLLRPWHTNTSKRLIKSPKLYFNDTGVACQLLGIRTVDQLKSHYSRGALFENWVINELAKHYTNQGLRPPLYFLRDQKGREVDVIVQNGGTIHAIEVKSGATVASDFFKGLEVWRPFFEPSSEYRAWLVYGGEQRQTRTSVTVQPWNDLAPLSQALNG